MKKSSIFRLSVAIFLFMLSSSVLLCGASKPMIPSLPWEVRPDWVSVKTPQTWHGQTAKGDGIADDTSALQLALGAAKPMGGTVYLPPGKYRITRPLIIGTLQQSSATRPTGFNIIGHGRDTTIIWDGPAGLPMVQLIGICESRIIGITFDAGNKAESCIEMGGPGFQAHNLFRHCAFLNAKFAAIDSGRRKMNTACTEQRIDNCLFVNCGRGVSLADFNDYDCVIEGCEFRECGYGVWTWKGMFYCRDTHFEGSRKADFHIESEHTSSIRRVTSYASNRFVENFNPSCSLVIQDCRVAEWKDPQGAAHLNIVPNIIFDTTFTGRLQGASPALYFRHTDTENLVSCNKFANSNAFKLISSNNTVKNAVFYKVKDNAAVKISEIPAGEEAGDTGLTARTSFLKTKAVHGVYTTEPRTACIPGKIFDVKRDFGAKGGEHDDTQAFKKAIEAAKAHGKGAMVYFQPGHYAVKETLVLDGADYYFGGSGTRSWLSWYGKAGEPLLHVDSPESLALEGFETYRMGGHKDGIDILHTGGKGKSLVTYDNVRVFGFLTPQPLVRGLRFRNLGAQDKVISRGTFGNVHLTDCQAAELLFNNHYEGVFLVEGKNPVRTGITAIQFTLLEICDPCIWIKDNNSLVTTDFYNEQAISLYRFEGNGYPEPGRLSLGSVKVEAVNNNRVQKGYKGEITICNPQYYKNTLHGRSFFNNDAETDVDYLEIGGYYFVHSMNWNHGPGFRARFLGTGGGPDKDTPLDEFLKRTADAPISEISGQAVRFFNDIRRVGRLDLTMNFPGIGTPDNVATAEKKK